MSDNKQMSERFITGALLAVVGGFLDAYTYICRGKVFANAQTGNIVLLGIKCSQGTWAEAFRYVFPIAAFIVGVMAAESIRAKFSKHNLLHWRQIIVALEIVILTAVSFITREQLNSLANILVSLVCALQVEGFRKVNGLPYATTMCTGNLRSATEHLHFYLQTGEKQALNACLQYFGIILFFISGSALGSLLTSIYTMKAVLFACLILGVVLIVMFKNGGQKTSDRQ